MDRPKVTQPRGGSDDCDEVVVNYYEAGLAVGAVDLSNGESGSVASIWLKRDGKWVLREIKRPMGFRRR